MLCAADHLLGPRVDESCRALDFTLFFEDLVLGCVPPAVLLLLVPFALYQTRRQPVRVHEAPWIAVKLGILAALLGLQIAYLVVRMRSSSLRTQATIPSGILSVVSTASIAVLSCWQHRRSWRPSLLLGLYFPTMILCDVARARTLWLVFSRSSPTAPSLFTAATSLTALLLILEERRKKGVASDSSALTQETKSGVWDRTFFIWLLPVFRRGFRGLLTIDNLAGVDAELQADVLAINTPPWITGVANIDPIDDMTRPHALLQATFHAFASSFLAGILPRLVLLALTFAQPFLVTATISYVENQGAHNRPAIGKALIGAFALVYTGIAVATALYMRQAFRFILRVRGALDALIYRKTTRRRSPPTENERAAMTLMGTDVERIVTGLRDIHEMWASTVSIAIATWLLERQLSGACVVPLILAVAGFLATAWVASRSNTGQRRWIEKVQARLHTTAALLQNMKTIKMLGLTGVVGQFVESLRQAEIETSKGFRKLIIWQIVLSNGPNTIAPMVSFAVFSIIAAVKQDETLATSRAFTSLTLISLLTLPVYTLLQTLPALWQCLGCFDRIQEYCRAQVEPKDQGRLTDSVEMYAQPPIPRPEAAITFKDATLGWASLEKPVLHDLNLRIPHGSTTVVSGRVGSGKSTLLAGILGEATCLSGSIHVSLTRVGYCSQTPWLVNDTVRNNIVGFSAFDAERYAAVTWACALDEDLRHWPGGDAMIVGGGAMSLSGGQKQRVVSDLVSLCSPVLLTKRETLARAVYAQPELLLLDDIVSGLDLRTMEQITHRLLGPGGYLRRQQITVVLATHAGGHAYQDNPLAVDGLPVSRDSTTDETGCGRRPFLPDRSWSRPFAGNSRVSCSPIPLSPLGCPFPIRLTRRSVVAQLVVFRQRPESQSAHGQVLWRLCGSLDWIAFGTHPGMPVGYHVWGTPNRRTGLTADREQSTCHLHDIQLGNETSFGSSAHGDKDTDPGELTNRFSQDMELIDMMLPLVAINTADSAGSCLVKLGILCAVSSYAALTAPFFILALWVLQRFYLHTSRQVRLRDIEAKAPLYSHLLETIDGLATIRAFRWTTDFETKNDRLTTRSQIPIYTLYCVQQWLQVVLDMMVAVLVVILIAVFVFWPGMYTPGSVGVALNIVITFSTGLASLIKNWTMMETSIGAVARVRAFVRDTEPECPTPAPAMPPPGWPSAGAIEFRDVRATYRNDGPPALNSVSLQIPPGTKLAICGRSGSGKSSLILCFLRLLDIQQGTITVDGIHLATLDPASLRTRFGTVPQTPYFMPGSIRRNLDPHNTASDADIIRILQAMALWERVHALGGLTAELRDTDWSAGEQQLLCLGRALLRRSRILLLDEATSSMDAATATSMQHVLEAECRDCTVLAVMHQLQHVERYHLVALMDAGRIVELDSPAALLARDSEFSRLYRAQAATGTRQLT
ncbi:putative ABC multidrug transporter [Aspergillus fumigatus Af293]|uniref:ABC multidrug transporter, putative n=1 Tax=Aspergillus fumigatus (strain ATCC MYA-4609 / CBS 101355 / FGSC A1100 / Af293) TaxID=330879 RepID=Q4WVN3_ASPFU|nr:ABC multidrug transporter, putative [Aspergillus fumigatus Af293]EAL91343.1 ABC multidrug transporter, putative [Aspergillus fumigatus Af293]